MVVVGRLWSLVVVGWLWLERDCALVVVGEVVIACWLWLGRFAGCGRLVVVTDYGWEVMLSGCGRETVLACWLW